MLGYRITSLCASEIIILIYIVLLAISVSYVAEHEKPKLYLNSEYIIVYSMQSVLPLNLLKTDIHHDRTKFRFNQWMWPHNETVFNEVTSMMELGAGQKAVSAWIPTWTPLIGHCVVEIN